MLKFVFKNILKYLCIQTSLPKKLMCRFGFGFQFSGICVWVWVVSKSLSNFEKDYLKLKKIQFYKNKHLKKNLNMNSNQHPKSEKNVCVLNKP